MNTQQGADQGDLAGRPGAVTPTEEEMRAAYEAELERLTATDMIAQAAVSLLNVGAHRMGAPGPVQGAGADGPQGATGRDLEQVRDAVDGARALLEILERRIPRELGPLRDALSRLQLAYAQEIQSASPEDPPRAQEPHSREHGPADGAQAPERPGEASGPGPAETSGRLWVPGR